MKNKKITLWSVGILSIIGVSLEEAHARESKTVPVQPAGMSSLDLIKEQTKQLSYSLRQSDSMREGKIEAPGLYEFSSFFNQRDANTKDNLNDNIEKLRTSTIASIEKLLKQTS